jgi:protease IV
MEFTGQSNSPPQADFKPQQPKKRSWPKIIWGIVTGLSILGNIVMFILLAFFAMFAFWGIRAGDYYYEEVIVRGPAVNKIAVINLTGIIDEETAQDIYKQLRYAESDDRVKGVILRISSPGGLVSSSDQIYNEITKFRNKTGRPVVAFMQQVAASGGYYTSVACNSIVAEPTVITGSIGVIMNYFVLTDLLESKLGIEPVVIKSGAKKDWPSLFKKPDEEQLRYLQEKLIQPAYERFVDIVANSRRALTIEDVKRLADGSIFGADEALAEKLIDKVGYMDDAIAETQKLAGISKAKVVQYRKPFSLADLLSAKADSIPKLDTNLLHKLSTPQVMYLWSIH